MSTPASTQRGECLTAPGGLPASPTTAPPVSSTTRAGSAREVCEQGSAVPRPAVPEDSAAGRTLLTLSSAHLLPLALILLFLLVAIAATAWSYGFEHGWSMAYPLGVEEGARGAFEEGHQAGREDGYRTGWWDCAVETGQVS